MNDAAEASIPVRAIIADDHPLVLLAIENLVRTYPNMQIVGRAADATELFMQVDRSPCDLVLMDLYMPGNFDGTGLDVVKQFKTRYPDVALIVLTMETEAAALQRVIALGVDGLVSKRDRIDLIHVAVVTALARAAKIVARWLLPDPGGPTSASAGVGHPGQRSIQATASALHGAIRKSVSAKLGQWGNSNAS